MSKFDRMKRSDQIAADQAMIAGIQKFFGSTAQITVGSQTLAPSALVQIYQDRIAKNLAAQAAEASRAAAVLAIQNELAQTNGVDTQLRQLVQATYSQSPDTLAVFGLKPRKVSVRTADEKALAAARAKATREARHTMGTRQKAGIKGSVSTVEIGSPSPEPATPAATPATAKAMTPTT